MKSLRKFSFIFFLALIPLLTFAQRDSTNNNPDNPKPPHSDRIFVGGNAALSFGLITLIGASPIVGYKVNDNWMVGIGGSYYYFKNKFYTPPVENSIYGGLLMSRYQIYRGLFVEGDFEENNQIAYAILPNGDLTTQREWIPSLLLGGGYTQSIGGRSAFFISILYDVIQNPNSQYYQVPVIRAGFGFGL